MRSLMNVFGGLRIRALSLLMAMVLVLAVIVGMAGQTDAQTSRYTLDDVMDKLIEMDTKFEVRLGKLETKVDMFEKRMDGLDKRIDILETSMNSRMNSLEASMNGRMSSLNVTMISLFGILGALFGGILVSVISIARNMRPAESSKAFRKEVREIAERERALEEKLQAADRRAPKEAGILEALRQEVSALAERQSELEGKLKLVKVG